MWSKFGKEVRKRYCGLSLLLDLTHFIFFTTKKCSYNLFRDYFSFFEQRTIVIHTKIILNVHKCKRDVKV